MHSSTCLEIIETILQDLFSYIQNSHTGFISLNIKKHLYSVYQKKSKKKFTKYFKKKFFFSIKRKLSTTLEKKLFIKVLKKMFPCLEKDTIALRYATDLGRLKTNTVSFGIISLYFLNF